MKKIFSKSQSFTLVEMLVAAAIFVILITLGMSSFSTMVKARKHADTSTNLQEAGRVIMERIAKEAENINMLISQDAMVTATTGYVDHGFIILQEGFEVGSGTNGQTIEGPILKIYKPEDKWIAFHLSNNSATCSTDCRLQMKDKSGEFDLSPATVNVTSLSFKGYHPGTGIQPFSTTPMVNRQAPYVTINLTLRDETTGQVASFKTTVSPEIRTSFLPHVQIQSGFQANPTTGDKSNFEESSNTSSTCLLDPQCKNNFLGYRVNFDPQKPFDSPPDAVIISKNYGDYPGWELMPKIYDIATDSFLRNVPACNPDSTKYCGNNGYGVNWISVQGQIKGILETGFTLNRDMTPVGTQRQITFTTPFKEGSHPIVVFAINWWKDNEEMPQIINTTAANFTIAGNMVENRQSDICGSDSDIYQHQCGIYWVAIDWTEIPTNLKPYLQAGFAENKKVCLRCAEPECSRPLDLDGRCLRTEISFDGLGNATYTDVDSCKYSGCNWIIGQVEYPKVFSSAPIVVAARNWFKEGSNMLKIHHIKATGFQYEGDAPPTSKAIYWIAAANGNYSTKWSYQ